VEERVSPAVFNIAAGDIAGLAAAIATSNTNNEADIINLAPGTYNFTAVADPQDGGNALPTIDSDNDNVANTLTINGNGAVFQRTGVNQMRFLRIAGLNNPAVVIVNDLTFQKGLVTGNGGAVLLTGSSVTFSNCSFLNNSATNGGAIEATSNAQRTLVLNDCLLDSNSAGTGDGGAIRSFDQTDVVITTTKITNNKAQETPGISVNENDLTITDSSITGNVSSGAASYGGGVFSGGTVTVTGSDISNNVAGIGGGFLVIGTLNVTNSSITGNTATLTTSGGGGIFFQGTLNFSNSTLHGNRAGNGAGIVMFNGSKAMTIATATITGNKSFDPNALGGGILVLQGNATIYNSIIAENGFDPGIPSDGPDIKGTVNSFGFNLIGNGDGATITGTTTGNLVGTSANPINPLLDVLGNYGGNTLTRPLLPGSPALDAGDPNFVPPPDFDQRGVGFPRTYGRIDIGAFEAPQVDVAIVKDDGGLTVSIPGQGIIYTIVVSNLGPGPADGVIVRDILTSQFSGATWTAQFFGGATGNVSGTGSINESVNMPVGSQIIYTMAAVINPSATGTLENIAQVLPPPGFSDPVPGNNTSVDSNALSPIIDAKVVKTGPAAISPGQQATYTIVVSNDGPSTATSITLSDIFPPSLINVNWTSFATGGASGNSPFGFGNITEFLTVPPNATVTYVITADVSANAPDGALVNTAFLTIPDTMIDADPLNNVSSATTNVIIGKQVIAAGADRGQLPLVRLFNPLNGTLRKQFLAYDARFLGGVRVATADFNGDGVLDIVTAPGPGGGPHIRVFDGNTGLVLTEFFAYAPGFIGGVYVAAGDVNGDGTPDIVTGAGEGGGPHVRVFNGGSPQVLPGFDFFAYGAGFLGGVRVAVGDTNRDGFADVITGAGPGGGPHVNVFSGANRALLLSFFSYSATFRGGVYVTSADMNFDGFADIITGAGEGGGAHVRYVDGRNGLSFREFFAFPVNTGGIGSNALWTSGVRISAISDINGDGAPDLVAVGGPGRPGRVRIISGATTGLIREFESFDPSYLGGVYVGSA
jgi:uncharacterized repeat protein (TIGR01451 family)